MVVGLYGWVRLINGERADKGQIDKRRKRVNYSANGSRAYILAHISCIEDGALESVSRAKEWLISVFSVTSCSLTPGSVLYTHTNNSLKFKVASQNDLQEEKGLEVREWTTYCYSMGCFHQITDCLRSSIKNEILFSSPTMGFLKNKCGDLWILKRYFFCKRLFL